MSEGSFKGIVKVTTDKFGGGINIEDIWYNASEQTKDFVLKIKKGDMVAGTYIVKAKGRKEINYIAKPEQQEDSGSSEPVAHETIKDNDRHNSIVLQCLMKVAAQVHSTYATIALSKNESPKTFLEILESIISIYERKSNE